MEYKQQESHLPQLEPQQKATLEQDITLGEGRGCNQRTALWESGW